jgi:hypothetical protein
MPPKEFLRPWKNDSHAGWPHGELQDHTLILSLSPALYLFSFRSAPAAAPAQIDQFPVHRRIVPKCLSEKTSCKSISSNQETQQEKP